MAIRDYLLTTRAVDPVAARERADGPHVQPGTRASTPTTCSASLAYVSFQELATRVSHRNTGATGDPTCDRLLARVAADENLHMVFYRNLLVRRSSSTRTRRWPRSATW